MELALPITVYWDLAPCSPLDGSLLRLCDEILACRPLMLQLYDPSHTLSEGVRAILERFRGTPVAVSLTVPNSSVLALAGTSNAELGVKELLIACDDLEVLGAVPCLPEAGLAFFVTRSNWCQLPEVVSLCRERGFNRLVLPMQRLFKGDEPFLLDRNEQGILERALAAVGGTAGFRLTIHDPFLWRAFNPGIPFPQGGCQAANTMIAISPDGGVYPCPTLPVRLGELGAASLQDILTSKCKKDFRRSLLLYPEACRDCSEVAECKGGCRGRAYVMHNSLDGVDESCR
jgi:GeoRSP system SPASM domain protein